MSGAGTAGTAIVVGAANLDLSFRAPQLPAAGETTGGAQLSEGLGGKGANQAVAAARLGAGVRFVAALGDDEAGAELERVLAAEGVDTEACARIAGQRTGRACIWLDGDGENRILVAAGANAELGAASVNSALAARGAADVLLCQLETPADGIDAALAWARRVGARTIVNTAPAAPLEELGERPEVLVANEPEARLLAPQAAASPRDLAAALGRRFGAELVVVTRGAAGACLWSDGAAEEVPAPSVRAVDTTAAGDAFCGAFAARLAAGDRPRQAATVACAAGALATTQPGAIDAIPSAEQVRELIAAEGS